jgi:hypothetical protein
MDRASRRVADGEIAMDDPHAIGWMAFALGFAWRILDEATAKVLYRLGARAARYYDKPRRPA